MKQFDVLWCTESLISSVAQNLQLTALQVDNGKNIIKEIIQALGTAQSEEATIDTDDSSSAAPFPSSLTHASSSSYTDLVSTLKLGTANCYVISRQSYSRHQSCSDSYHYRLFQDIAGCTAHILEEGSPISTIIKRTKNKAFNVIQPNALDVLGKLSTIRGIRLPLAEETPADRDRAHPLNLNMIIDVYLIGM